MWITSSSHVHKKNSSSSLLPSLTSFFSLEDLGHFDYFLGIVVPYLSNGSLILSQSKYIKDLLSKARILNAKGVYFPMAFSTKFSKVGSANVSDPTKFRSIVGVFQYATITRSEILALNKMCQFMYKILLKTTGKQLREFGGISKGSSIMVYFLLQLITPLLSHSLTFVMMTRPLTQMTGGPHQGHACFLVIIWYLSGLRNKH